MEKEFHGFLEGAKQEKMENFEKKRREESVEGMMRLRRKREGKETEDNEKGSYENVFVSHTRRRRLLKITNGRS